MREAAEAEAEMEGDLEVVAVCTVVDESAGHDRSADQEQRAG